MKTILVPTEQSEGMTSALHTAVLLARRFDGYIEGFALRPRLNEFTIVPLETIRQEDIEAIKKTRIMFECVMSDHDVPRSGPTTSSVSFGWRDDAPEGESVVGSYGRVFDIVVLSRPHADETHIQHRAFESALFESGRPILISPPSPPKQLATNVLIAWNCSTEQACAIALAMPLLERAERVTVLTVAGGAAVPGPSGEQLTRCLQRNGIAATPLTVELEGRTTGEAILATAGSLGCDLLIKGAYTQSRLRQLIFGGTTRHILANATLPVLMAH
jgi:nucleotide-binding universal stress UspA family protein